MSNLETRIRAYIDKVTCLCGHHECERDLRLARAVLATLDALSLPPQPQPRERVDDAADGEEG